MQSGYTDRVGRARRGSRLSAPVPPTGWRVATAARIRISPAA